jgi:hypothetical protein
MEWKNLSDSELRALNTAICDELKRRHRAKCAAATLEFGVGDLVEFTSDRYGVIRGTIESMGPKNIVVRAEKTNMKWKVTATLVRYIESSHLVSLLGRWPGRPG